LERLAVVTMQFELQQADSSQYSAFCQLWQFYQYHQSRFDGEDIDVEGRFDVDEGFLKSVLAGREDCDAYFILVRQRIAGFVTVERTTIAQQEMPELADLFVLPKYRNQGLAAAVVEQLMLGSGAQWHVAIYEQDQLAHSFWERLFTRLKIAGKVLAVNKIKPSETEGFSEFVVSNA
jgi:predicted acetyltransferase